MEVEDGGAVDKEVHAVAVGVKEVVGVKIYLPAASPDQRVSARTMSARESFARAAELADLLEPM